MSAPPRPVDVQVVFLDVDNVLYDGNLGLDLAKKMVGGFRAVKALSSLTTAVVKYKAGRIAFDAVVETAGGLFAGQREDTTFQKARHVGADLRRNVRSGGQHLVDHYRAAGVPVVLFSTAPQVVVDVIAETVGATAAFGSRVKTEAGILTKTAIRPLPYGPGKVELAQSYVDTVPTTLEQAAYYGDSSSDAHLLEAVGHPICVNASKGLSKLAPIHGWSLYSL